MAPSFSRPVVRRPVVRRSLRSPSNVSTSLTTVRKNGLIPRLEDIETEVFGNAGEGKIPDRLKAVEDLAPLEVKSGGGKLHDRIERLERYFIP